MSMGDRIKEKRIEKGLTMEQLADKLGVGKSAVNKWEKGHVQNIKRSTIEKMCLILDCSPAYLFGWDECIIDYAGMNEELAYLKSIMTGEEILTDTEKQIIIEYRSLTDDQQKQVQRLLEYNKKINEMFENNNKKEV